MTGRCPAACFADRLFESRRKSPRSLFEGVKVECEFAFRLTRELPAGKAPVTRDQIAGSLTFHPAFELAGSRFAPGTGNRAATTFDGVADNGSGGAAVLGPAVDRLADAAVRNDGDRRAHRRQPADPDLHRRLSARSRDDHGRNLLGPAGARRAAARRHGRAHRLALAADAGAQGTDRDGDVQGAAAALVHVSPEQPWQRSPTTFRSRSRI